MTSCGSASTWTTDCAIIPAALATGGNSIPETTCSANGVIQPRRCELRLPGLCRGGGLEERLPRLPEPDHGQRVVTCSAGQAGCEPRHASDPQGHLPLRALRPRAGLRLARATRSCHGKSSGIADPAGGDFMVTLGLWDQQNGTPFVQGSTLLHELGHNLGLRHGGRGPLRRSRAELQAQLSQRDELPVPGTRAAHAVGRPDHRPVAAAAAGAERVRPGRERGARRSHAVPPDAGTRPPRTSFIDTALGTSPATRRCDGSTVTWGRTLTTSGSTGILGPARPMDWNGNGRSSGTDGQDVNFDGAQPGRRRLQRLRDHGPSPGRCSPRDRKPSVELQRQRRRPATLRSPLPRPSAEVLSLDTGFGDLGFGDLGFGDLGFGDLGFGDLGFGDLGFGDLGFGDLGFGDLGLRRPGRALRRAARAG